MKLLPQLLKILVKQLWINLVVVETVLITKLTFVTLVQEEHLVLVNGLRRANYPYPSGEGDASFNWNRIPIGIVERIEILTSGASAIYGADAVAGVVNIILVDGIEDTSVQVRVGAHQPFTNRSAGESVNIEISGGQYFDSGSMVWGIELNTVNPLNGKDRTQLDDYL